MKAGRQLERQSAGYFPIWRPIISEFLVVMNTPSEVGLYWETKLWVVFGNSPRGLIAYPLVYALYNLILLSLIPGQIKSLLGNRWTLPLHVSLYLTVKYTQIRGNLCTRLGVVFVLGQWSLLCTHILPCLSCRQQQFLSHWWNIGRFHPVVQASLLSVYCLFIVAFLYVTTKTMRWWNSAEKLKVSTFFVCVIDIFTFLSMCCTFSRTLDITAEHFLLHTYRKETHIQRFTSASGETSCGCGGLTGWIL